MEALKKLDEITLIEILDLHSDEIVDKFQELIEERYDTIRYKVEDPNEGELREEEKYEPLTGELSWKTSHEETLDWSDFEE